MADRSRFPDGFRRDLIEQLFTAAGDVDLSRGDALIRFNIPAGTFELVIPDPIFNGQLLVFQAGTDAGGSVTVITTNAVFNDAGDFLATFADAGGVFSVVGQEYAGALGPVFIWKSIIVDAVTLSG